LNKEKDELEYLKVNAKPFYFEGSDKKPGILLTHGLTASPTEMLPLGKFLHTNGYTVYGVRLAGHSTHYRDLPNYSYQDWINSVKEGLILLKENYETIIPIGISMGAVLSTLLVHRNSDVTFEKLVLISPAFDLQSKLAKLTPILSHFINYIYKGDTVLQYYKDHDLYAYYYYPLKAVAQFERLRKIFWKESILLKLPTLIIYGILDDLISTKAIDKLIKTKFISEESVKIHTFQQSGHNFTTDPDAIEAFDTILNFIET
jgi:carboxylesterase